MGPQERQLLQLIVEEPEDQIPRLIYADWLDERNDPRGEFIRLELRCRQMSDDDPQRPDLERRKLSYLRDRRIETLRPDPEDIPHDDETELALAELGIPLLPDPDRRVTRKLARLSCQPFDFTNSVGMRFHLVPTDDIPFHVGVYHVSQHEYQQVVGEDYVRRYASGTGALTSGALTAETRITERPVQFSLWEATEFCGALSAQEGITYHMLSEPEWEHANGVDDGRPLTWLNDTDDLVGPYPRGSFRPNLFGICDIHSGLPEWGRIGSPSQHQNRFVLRLAHLPIVSTEMSRRQSIPAGSPRTSGRRPAESFDSRAAADRALAHLFSGRIDP